MKALPDPLFVAVVDGYFAAVRDRNEARWLDSFATDAVCHDPVGGEPVEGRDGLRQVWSVLTGPFKSLTIVQRETFYCGPGAAIRWSAEGTGINDGHVRFSGITVFEFSPNGKIQTAMSYWDPAAMLIDLAGESPALDDSSDPALHN